MSESLPLAGRICLVRIEVGDPQIVAESIIFLVNIQNVLGGVDTKLLTAELSVQSSEYSCMRLVEGGETRRIRGAFNEHSK